MAEPHVDVLCCCEHFFVGLFVNITFFSENAGLFPVSYSPHSLTEIIPKMQVL